MKKFLKIISLPYILALLFTSVFLLVLPISVKKDALKIEQKIGIKENGTALVEDLNGDGEAEVINAGEFDNYLVYALIKDIDQNMYGQWNGNNNYVPNSPILVGDYDSDQKKELYLFSYKGDSVYLNIIEYFDPDGIDIKGIFVDVAPLTNDFPGYSIIFSGEFDGNNDGKKDMHFSIKNGFALYPRKIYRYDVANNLILKSDNYGNIFSSHCYNKDLTGDGVPEILGYMSATGNYPEHSNIKYKDNSAWLFAFNNKFDFVFPPVEYNNQIPVVTPLTINTDSGTYIVIIYRDTNAFTKNTQRIDIYSPQGKLVKQIPLNIQQYFVSAWYPDDNEQKIFLQFRNSSNIYCLTKNLEIKKEGAINSLWDRPFGKTSTYIGAKKRIYFAYNQNNSKLSLLDHKFNEIASTTITNGNYVKNVKKVPSKANQNWFYLQLSKNKGYILSYNNKVQFTDFIIPTLIYLIILGILFTGKWIYSDMARHRQETVNQLTKFQMLSIKNQLDPHFTFNAVNTLGNLIYGDNKEKAYNYLVKFSSLLKKQLTSSDKLLITLGEEVNATKDYLALQEYRFKNNLKYHFEISNTINLKTLVPRLCIQTYTENAIKHGLKPKDGEGFISISIQSNKGQIIIEIKDNGVGREKAKQLNSFSTGKGIHSMNQLYEYLNTTTKDKIVFEIIDLFNEENFANGTLVRLIIPGSLKEKV